MMRILLAAFCFPALPPHYEHPTSSPLGSISGRMIDATTGSPIAGIDVMYRKTDGPPQALRAKTDEEGRYRIPDLAAGRYSFFGVMPQVSGYSSNGRLVVLAAGEELSGVD